MYALLDIVYLTVSMSRSIILANILMKRYSGMQMYVRAPLSTIYMCLAHAFPPKSIRAIGSDFYHEGNSSLLPQTHYHNGIVIVIAYTLTSCAHACVCSVMCLSLYMPIVYAPLT